MSNRADWPNSKGLKKEINGNTFYLGRSWDLVNGKGWFAQFFPEDLLGHGSGFHKTNKFSAIRAAIKSAYEDRIHLVNGTGPYLKYQNN